MEYLNDIILPIFLNTTILVVWFLTNAYYEYGSLIFPKLFNKYNLWIKENSFLYFADYLSNFNIFFYKLFSCPFCLGFWTSIFSCLVYSYNITYICVIYIISIAIYFLIKRICCN